MCENQGEDDGDNALRENDPQKVRPPNKKKFDDEMEDLQLRIKERETQLEKVKSGGNVSISQQLKTLKEKKGEAIANRRQIDAELDKVNKDIPEKMKQQTKLESYLSYRSEDKINAAIHRLEWNLNAQRFKLSEEKKIVSEIDRLKRSKRTLVQYQSVRQEIGALRDKQRKMREERDKYFRAVSEIKEQENKLRMNSSAAKSSFSTLKQEIDELYERRRQLVAIYRRDRDSYQGVREQRRRDSWKRKDEDRRAYQAGRLKQQVDLEMERLPYESELHACTTLLNHLGRLAAGSQESSLDSLSPASSQDDPDLVEEMDDGLYVLLRKSDDLEGPDYSSVGIRKLSRKNRRSRKQSMVKKIVHTPEILADFVTLGLEAPHTMKEVLEVTEKLKAKRAFFEREQQPNESSSDAGVSATESIICELSRQASKTESCEGAADTHPGEQVMADLLKDCHGDGQNVEDPEAEQGAVGGSHGSETSDTLSPQSDDLEGVRGGEGKEEEDQGVSEKNSKLLCPKPSVVVTPSEEMEGDCNLMKSWPAATGVSRHNTWSEASLHRMPARGRGESGELAGHSVSRRESWKLRHQKQHLSGSQSSCDVERPSSLWSTAPPTITPDLSTQNTLSLTSPLDFPSLAPTTSNVFVNSSQSKDDNFLLAQSPLGSPRSKQWFDTPGVDLTSSGQWASKHQTLAQRLSSPTSLGSSLDSRPQQVVSPADPSSSKTHAKLRKGHSSPVYSMAPKQPTDAPRQPQQHHPPPKHKTLAQRLSSPVSSGSGPETKPAAAESFGTSGHRAARRQALAPKLSAPTPASASTGGSVYPRQPPLSLDSAEFPPLSHQTTAAAPFPRRRGSTFSSGSSSVTQELTTSSASPTVPASEQQHQLLLSSSSSLCTAAKGAADTPVATTTSPRDPSSRIVAGGGVAPVAMTLTPPTPQPQPSHPNTRPPPLVTSKLGPVDKSSTERWVESSVVFTKDLGADESGLSTESTRL